MTSKHDGHGWDTLNPRILRNPAGRLELDTNADGYGGIEYDVWWLKGATGAYVNTDLEFTLESHSDLGGRVQWLHYDHDAELGETITTEKHTYTLTAKETRVLRTLDETAEGLQHETSEGYSILRDLAYRTEDGQEIGWNATSQPLNGLGFTDAVVRAGSSSSIVDDSVILDDAAAALNGPVQRTDVFLSTVESPGALPYVHVRNVPLEGEGRSPFAPNFETLYYADGTWVRRAIDTSAVGDRFLMRPAAVSEFERPEHDVDQKPERRPSAGGEPAAPGRTEGAEELEPGLGEHPAGAAHGSAALREPNAGEVDAAEDSAPEAPDAEPDKAAPPLTGNLLLGAGGLSLGLVHGDAGAGLDGFARLADPVDGALGDGLGVGADLFRLDRALDLGDDWGAAGYAVDLAADAAAWLDGGAESALAGPLEGVGGTLGAVAGLADLDAALDAGDYVSVVEDLGNAAGWAGSALGSAGLGAFSSALDEFVPYAGLFSSIAEGNAFGVITSAVGMVNPVAGVVLSVAGSVLGGLLGDDDPPPPPEAFAELGVDAEGRYYVADAGDAHGGNGGAMAVAAQQAANVMNAAVAATGGRLLDPEAIPAVRIGYDGDGLYTAGRHVDSLDEALGRVAQRMLGEAPIEGGDVHAKRALYGELAGGGALDLDALEAALVTGQRFSALQDQRGALEALAGDLGIAVEIEALADGAREPGELSAEAQHLLAAREVERAAQTLELEQPHRFDHASRLTGALEQAGVDLTGVRVTDLVLALDHGRLVAAVADPGRPQAALGALPHAAIDWHADGREAAMLHLPEGGDWSLADLVERLGLEDGGRARAVADAFAPDAEVGTSADDGLAAGPDGDELHGLAGDDRLHGGAGDDRLRGGAGADLLDGGAGRDTAVYAGSDERVQVDLATGAARGGEAWGDRLAGVEDIEGSGHDDALAGDGGANRLAGDAGDDHLAGADGGDTLLGETGDDRLAGGRGNDRLAGGDGDDLLLGDDGDDVVLGGSGDDVLAGGEGADLVAGGDGRDTAVFSGAFAEHRVAYASGGEISVEGPGGDRDRLSGVERLRFDDRVLELQEDGDWATLGAGSRRRAGRSAETAGGWGEAAALGILAGIASQSRVLAAEGADAPALRLPADDALPAPDAPAAPSPPAAPAVALPAAAHLAVAAPDSGAPAGEGGAVERGLPGLGTPAATPATPASAPSASSGRDAASQPLAGVATVPAAARESPPPAEAGQPTLSGSEDTALPKELHWEGTAGDDVIRGSDVRDIIHGRAGDDRLFGEEWDDRLHGGPGDDWLHGGPGADLLDGGPGTDVASYRGAASGVSVDLAADRTGGAAAGDRLRGIEWLEGTDHADSLAAAPGQGVRLWGRGGDDGLRGSALADIVEGGEGADALHGRAGDDRLLGGGGDDALHGGPGSDALSGGAGDDALRGGAGDDTLDAGAGDDTLHGGAGDDRLYGGDGNDILRGGSGADVLWGGAGNDVLVGGPGDDSLVGGAGDDRLEVDGDDEPYLVDGGSGTDTLVLAEPGGWHGDVRGPAGVERVEGSAEGDQVTASTAFERIDLGGGRDSAVLPGVSVFSAGLVLDPEAGSARVSDADGEAVEITAETLLLDEGAVFLDGRNNAPFTRDDRLAGREDTWVRFDPQGLARNDRDIDAGDAVRVTAVGGVDIALTRGLDARYWDAAHAEAQADALAAGGERWQVRRGGAGNDQLAAGDGNALVLGAGGERDTAVLPGRRDDYRLEAAGDHLEATRLDTGASDRLYGIQGLRFTDGSLFLGEADVRDGVVQVTGEGARFRGDRDWFGETAIRYTAGDGRGGQAPGQLTLDIAPVNDSPWLYREVDYDGEYGYRRVRSPEEDPRDTPRQGYYAAEGSGRLLGVDVEDTAGGIDVSGTLRYALVSQPSIGEVSLSPDGRFSYRLNQGEDAGRWMEEEHTYIERDGVNTRTEIRTRWVWQPPEDVVHDTDDVERVSFRVRVTDSEDAATESTVTIENSRPRGGGKKPLALDLDGDGLEFTDIDDSGIEADVNGDGWLDRMAWIGADDALLTLDRDGDGRVSGFEEISFVDDHPEARTDMEGLALAFDADDDGDLDRDDAAWERLALWQDGDGDGVEDRGERLTLTDAGIVRIGVVSDGDAERVGDVSVFGRSRFETTDGDSGVVGDVAFHFAPRPPAADADELAALAAQRVAQAAASSPSPPLAGAAPAPTPALGEGPVEEPTELAG